MNVRFLTIVEQEVDDAYQRFEERTEGTGLEFLHEIDRVLGPNQNFSVGSFRNRT